MNFLPSLAALIAASFRRFSRSAPVNPAVSFAIDSKSISFATFLYFPCIFNISSLPFASGEALVICLSSLLPTILFVKGFNIEKNELIVGEEKEIFSKETVANEINLILVDEITKPIQVMAKIRYAAKEAKATIYPIEEGKIKVEFEEPQRAITPGQSIVFYIGDIVLGGGKII